MKHFVAAVAAAASIFIVFKLQSTLKELQNAVKLLQRSAQKLCEKDTVEIAAENVSAVNSVDERVTTDVNVMIDNIAHTYDTATKMAHNLHAIMLKAVDTNDVAKKISQDVNEIMLKTDDNVKALQLISQSFQQTHDTINSLPATINTTAEKYSMHLHNEHVQIMAACNKIK